MTLKKFLSYTIGAILALGFSTYLSAATYHDPGSCVTNTNGTVTCKGVYKDMAANPNIYIASFSKTYNGSTTTLWFQMYMNGTFYYCWAPNTFLNAWDSVLSSRNSDFSITMTPANGTCTSLSIYNSVGTM